MTVLNIPPSSIALFSIFLFNCVNVIIGYSTNVLGMSVFQLMFIQSVSTYLPTLLTWNEGVYLTCDVTDEI
jgi:hypothetical protein